MDPTACLKLILDYYSEEDSESAMNSTIDLNNWLDRGGFFPDLSKLNDDQSRQLVWILINHISP